MSALASGCSRVIITDVIQEKLNIASGYGITPVNITKQNVVDTVNELTNGWGVDVIFEASGNESAIANIFDPLCPGGTVVFIGMPVQPVPVDIVAAQAKEAVIKTIFRYAHVYPRAINLMSSGKIDVKQLITDTYKFKDGVAAFEYAANPRPTSVKIIIEME
jgi:D-xylulose reductase